MARAVTTILLGKVNLVDAAAGRSMTRALAAATAAAAATVRVEGSVSACSSRKFNLVVLAPTGKSTVEAPNDDCWCGIATSTGRSTVEGNISGDPAGRSTAGGFSWRKFALAGTSAAGAGSGTGIGAGLLLLLVLLLLLLLLLLWLLLLLLLLLLHLPLRLLLPLLLCLLHLLLLSACRLCEGRS